MGGGRPFESVYGCTMRCARVDAKAAAEASRGVDALCLALTSPRRASRTPGDSLQILGDGKLH